MAHTVPDDIFALCSRFNLDLDRYRIFPRAEPASASAVRSILSSVPEPPNFIGDVSSAQESRGSDGPSEQVLGSSSLRNLLAHVGVADSRRAERPLLDLLQSSVVVAAATGGAGATTVTATIARLMSREHQRCGVIAEEDNAVLPCYLGDASPLRSGRPAFSVASGADAPVRILGRQEMEREASKAAGSYELDQVLIDLENGFDVRSARSYLDAAAVLIVSVPDVNSVIRARRLKEILAEKSPAAPVVCVLNKFDSSQPLHCEIRDRFTQTFSTTVTLCRTDLVNEALAEGMTVVDWAPRSDLAQEYSQLLGVLQETLRLQSTPEAVKAC